MAQWPVQACYCYLAHNLIQKKNAVDLSNKDCSHSQVYPKNKDYSDVQLWVREEGNLMTAV